MGREIRRVALDFNWPLKKTWDGFVNPHGGPCPGEGKTCFSGYSAAGKWLDAIVRLLMVAGEDARSQGKHNGIWPHPYLREFGLAPTDKTGKLVPPSPELAQLTEGLAGRPADSFIGHDSIDNWAAQKKIIEAAGLPKTWGWCSICNGSGEDPATAEQRKAWKPTPPPEGEGWQVWETVSEGSPVSPVFPTADALIDWLVKDGGGFGTYSREAAESFVKGSGWVPSAVSVGGKVYADIESAKLQPKPDCGTCDSAGEDCYSGPGGQPCKPDAEHYDPKLAQPKGPLHVIKPLRRFTRGRSAVFNRPTYGYVVECACGWSRRWNGRKREAESCGRDHIREMKCAAEQKKSIVEYVRKHS